MAGTTSWSVGELARATGLSVRVLRHWDEMGIVSPSRTRAGHRRYGPDEITRLYRALALRSTGLGLRRIADLLTEQDPDPSATLRAHLTELDADLRRRTELRDRLAEALDDDDPDLLTKVIATMTMFDQYVHGYRDGESTRLQDQAGTLVELLHGDSSYPDDARVLEVGCGVGAQTVTLARRSPGARFTAIDVSLDSLAATATRVKSAGLSNVTVAAADVLDLPHVDGPLAAAAFDHVFVCFVLEHLRNPVEVLQRLRTMVRPGGTITVIEGDHGSTYFHPDSPAARDAIGCQVTLQRNAGGDALIGRRLYPLLTDAGWDDVRVSPRTVYVDGSRPELAESFTRRTFTAMIDGIREPAVAAGLIEPAHFDEGIRALERTAESDGTFCYTFFKAVARRAEP